MKTTNEEQQAANSREAYEAPTCEIIEMQQEGVLCCSLYMHRGNWAKRKI